MSYAYPIIIVHTGNSGYLWTCLHQAHYSNPNSRIILLGDESNRLVPNFVEHYFVRDHMEEAKDFEKIYQHFSPNSREFELLCIQRWFIIYNFVVGANIDKFLHIDSDVLLYSDFSREDSYMSSIESCDFTISETSGHTSFFNSQNVLRRFIDFVIDLYSNSVIMDKIRMDYSSGSNLMDAINYQGGSLQDMALLTSFSKSSGVHCLDTSKNINSCNINLVLSYPRTPDFCNSGSIISTLFIRKQPYGIEKATRSAVRFHSLHFQGETKRLMRSYSTYDKSDDWVSPVLTYTELECIWGLKSKDTLELLPVSFSFLTKKLLVKFNPKRWIGNK